jgi:hypothetical protein
MLPRAPRTHSGSNFWRANTPECWMLPAFWFYSSELAGKADDGKDKAWLGSLKGRAQQTEGWVRRGWWKRPALFPDSRSHPRIECGHCSPGDPTTLIFLFSPRTCFFWQVFLLNWNLRPWFSLGGLLWALTQREGELEIGGPPPISQ